VQQADNHAAETTSCPRIGFLKDQFSVPADFDRMGEEEILAMFEGEQETMP